MQSVDGCCLPKKLKFSFSCGGIDPIPSTVCAGDLSVEAPPCTVLQSPCVDTSVGLYWNWPLEGRLNATPPPDDSIIFSKARTLSCRFCWSLDRISDDWDVGCHSGRHGASLLPFWSRRLRRAGARMARLSNVTAFYAILKAHVTVGLTTITLGTNLVS